MDQAPRNRPDDDGPPTPSEAALREAMDESDRDLAAGRTVPLQDVLRDLESLAGRMEARRNSKRG